jgi:4-amino-4-deoxy-L-arabinose transferase-like glycosyltransferase
VLPALAAVAIACASGRARALARLARPGDVLACAALVVAWYAAAWRVGGAGFTDRQIVQENVQRFVGWGRVPHRHGVLYYVPALAGGLLPWTPLLVFVRRPGGRSGWPPARVLVAWIVAVLGFYSLAAGKRSVYLLPLYPPLAVLLAAGVVPALQRARDDGPGRAALAAVGALGVLAFAVVAGALDPLLVGIGPLLGGSDAFRLPAVRAVVDQNRALLGIVVAGGAAGLFLWASAGRRVRVALLGGAALAWCALLTVLGTLPVAAETSPRDAARSLRRLVPRDAPICARGPVEYGFRYYADVPLARCGEGTGRDPAATELDVVPDATSGHVHYFVRIAGGAATALDGEERAR